MKPLAFSPMISTVLAVAFWVFPTQAKDAKLGMPQKTGPFQITLTTSPAAPQSGSNLFRVEVSRKGKVVSAAQVKLTLTMPLHRHGGRSDREPVISWNLKFVNGTYQGRTRLPMSTTWQAQVDVKTATEKGAVKYRFTAGKPAPVHLGMTHMADDFTVTLTTDPAVPHLGENRFKVKVERDGQPISDAGVTITLNQPAATKGPVAVMLEPDAAVKGTYHGTVRLAATGDWEARVAVQSGDAKGTALYQFSTAK